MYEVNFGTLVVIGNVILVLGVAVAVLTHKLIRANKKIAELRDAFWLLFYPTIARICADTHPRLYAQPLPNPDTGTMYTIAVCIRSDDPMKTQSEDKVVWYLYLDRAGIRYGPHLIPFEDFCVPNPGHHHTESLATFFEMQMALQKLKADLTIAFTQVSAHTLPIRRPQ